MGRREDAQAAVASCISILAAVTALDEKTLGRWLDLYYKVRRDYEIERGAEEDPQLIRREDLGPMLREAMHEAAKVEAAQRQKKKERIATPAGALARNDGAPAAAEVVQEGTKKPGPWTQYKRKVVGKLADARTAGISIASIAAASAGILGEHRVMDAINAGQLSREEWQALEKAIDLATAEAAGK